VKLAFDLYLVQRAHRYLSINILTILNPKRILHPPPCRCSQSLHSVNEFINAPVHSYPIALDNISARTCRDAEHDRKLEDGLLGAMKFPRRLAEGLNL
jgi:hypothetical protein